jgi:hypothetical protein
MPQSNMLIEAHNNQPQISGNKAVIVFPPDKNTSGTLGGKELDPGPFYHLGPGCADDGTTLCSAIISVSPRTQSGHTAREPTLAYFYTYQTYPPGKDGNRPGPCAAPTSKKSKANSAQARRDK